MVARRSKVSSALSQRINSVSSKEVKSNNFRTWSDVPVQLARNPPPRVIPSGFRPNSNSPVRGSGAKKRKVQHAKWAHNATTLHPTNVQQAHIGVQHYLCTIQLGSKKTCNKGML